MDPKEKLQSTNICELPFKIYREISHELNKQNVWKDLLAKVDFDSIYALDEKGVYQCEQNMTHSDGSAGILLKKWGDRGMRASELSDLLHQLRMERCLKLIKPQEKLKILEEPDLLISKDVGQNLELECVAVGFPYPRFTDKLHEYPTRKSGILSLNTLRCSDSGNYVCRVHNDVSGGDILWTNSAQWTRVEVRLVPGYNIEMDISSQKNAAKVSDVSFRRPVFTLQPKPVTNVDISQDFVVQCQAQGNPEPTYSWLKNDTLIENVSGNELWVRNATLVDAGTYTCIASNEHGESRSHPAKVFVKCTSGSKVPEITLQPKNQTQAFDGMATFQVEAQGDAPLYYRWFHHGNLIQGATSSNLSFNVKERSQAGPYKCIVTNYLPDGKELGMCVSREAMLIIDNKAKRSFTATDKLALLIAVSSTKVNHKKDLPGALNDLREMTTKLKELKFKTVSLLDLNLNEIKAAVDFFYDLMDPGVYVVVYLCGHGFLHCGRNYLVPWDAHLEPRPDDCFCVEDAVHKLQRKEPALFCMVLDICRMEYTESLSPNSQLTKLPPAKGNEIFLFAASQDEKSYEEKPGHNRLQYHPRGLFNQYFTRVITKNVPVYDLFKDVADYFKDCPHSMEKTPQHPQIQTSIREHDRSLCDPISSTGSTLEMDRRIRQWRNAHTVPEGKNYKFSIPQYANINVTVMCQEVFSNTLEIFVQLRPFGPVFIDPQKFQVKLLENTIPLSLKPIEPCQRKGGAFIFTVNNLQRLEGDLVLTLQIFIYFESLCSSFSSNVSVPFGTPLMAKQAAIFRKQYEITYTDKPVIHKECKREPTEHGS